MAQANIELRPAVTAPIVTTMENPTGEQAPARRRMKGPRLGDAMAEAGFGL